MVWVMLCGFVWLKALKVWFLPALVYPTRDITGLDLDMLHMPILLRFAQFFLICSIFFINNTLIKFNLFSPGPAIVLPPPCWRSRVSP